MNQITISGNLLFNDQIGYGGIN